MDDVALSFGNSSALSSTDDARLSRIEAALPRSVYGSNLYSNSAVAVPASSAVLSSGQISPSSGIDGSGNLFTFVVQGAFAFSWDGSALTIYWDGTNGSSQFVIRRADGSQQSVPRGNLRIGGVAANTKYAFAPFVATAQPEGVSFAIGDTGTPRYALSPSASSNLLATASQTQRLTTNERLTDGLIYFTTGASQTSATGGGTGGNSSPYTGANYSANKGEQLGE